MTDETKSTLLPSGDQVPPEASVEIDVTFLGSPVSAPLALSKSCTQICVLPPSRADSKITRLPSGEKRMRSSPTPLSGVSRLASPPATGMIQRCGVLVLASRLTSTALKATHLLSGETVGSPTRLSCIMSSKVKGCLACAVANRENANRKNAMRRNMTPPRRGRQGEGRDARANGLV